MSVRAATLEAVSEVAGADRQLAGDGLVICAITGREIPDTSKMALWSPKFPGPELVKSAAGLFDHVPWDGNEGQRPFLQIGPGVLSFRRVDLSKQERAHERQLHRHQIDLAMLTGQLKAGEVLTEAGLRRIIEEWSRRSRSRMVERVGSLDFTPMMQLMTGVRAADGIPGMVTLTYSGCWLKVAPTGKAVKAHLKQFVKRWERAWGSRPIGLWKLEFQGRSKLCDCETCAGRDDGRAPHVHIYTVPAQGLAGEARREKALADGSTYYRPAVGDGLAFRQWLSTVWADIVAHPNPEERAKHLLAGTSLDFAEGMRSSDPKRLAIYFGKHGSYKSKEYQHRVPAAWKVEGGSPGRFWGYWGLQKAVGSVTLGWDDYQAAVRVTRRWAAAQGTTRLVTVMRVNQRTGAIKYRQVRRRVNRLRQGGGFVMVNDGPAFASAVARAVNIMRPDPPPDRGALVLTRNLPHNVNILFTPMAECPIGKTV
jgi:hypothetical protein